MVKYIYESDTEIPEHLRDLYEQTENGYMLSKIEGAPSLDDVTSLTKALRLERKLHAETKKRMHNTPKEEPEETLPQINNTNLDLLQKERDKLAKQVNEANERLKKYEQLNKQRTIRDVVQAAARKHKVVDSAVDDIAFIAEHIFDLSENGSVMSKEGLMADEWLTEMKNQKPHWWPQSSGGGASGSGYSAGSQGNNPWSTANWNMTEQARIFKSDPVLAEKLEKQASSAEGETSSKL